jgi:RNA polymerase sigma-70 factor (ECF subfamily)
MLAGQNLRPHFSVEVVDDCCREKALRHMMEETTPAVRQTRAPSSNRAPAGRFERDLVALIPQLRAFARVLCRKRTTADDLVQDALAKAWRSRDCFEPGTNMKAWLFTILRNTFYSGTRRAWREIEWDAELGEQIAGPANAQEWSLGLSDVARALGNLPRNQREALILVGAGGFTYEAAGQICNAPSGTVKSRVARGRAALSGMVDGERQMPPRLPGRAMDTAGDILAQLSGVIRPGAQRAAAYAR